MAERAFVTRPTLRKLEAGDLTVSAAVLARVLDILGMDRDLDLIAASDETGYRLLEARMPRPHRTAPRDVTAGEPSG